MLRLLPFAFLLVACNEAKVAPANADEPADANAACDPATIRSRYGPMQLVAGKGREGDKGHNGWLPEYEGAKATDAELSRPHFAMADASGSIFIADKDAHAIRKIDAAGMIHTVAGTGEPGDDGDDPGPAKERRLSSPNGIWVAQDGALYVLDLGNGKVRRVSTTGEMTTLFVVDGGISLGRGLWVSPDESRALVSSGSRVLQWDGREVTTLASGFGGLGNLTVDGDGHVVVTDRTAGRVYRIDAKGTKQALVGDTLPGVRAVWFDTCGGMFLGTHESSRVWYVGSDGAPREFLGSDQVSEVRGLSIDAQGRLIIVDDDAGFIRVLNPASR